MSEKFQKRYTLQIEGNDGNFYTVEDPFTLEFTVSRNLLSSANTGYLRIYNLRKDIRNNVYHDIYDTVHPRKLSLRAGYEKSILPEIFTGKIKQAKSFRDEAATNFITEIEGYDDLAQSVAFSDFTLEPVPQVTIDQEMVINKLINDLERYGLKRGAVSDFSNGRKHYRGRTITGSTWEALQVESGVDCFVDNGKVHVLKTNDVFEGDVSIISSVTGLLSSPKKSDFLLSLELLFEPGLKIGQQIFLQSNSLEFINRQPIVPGKEIRPPTNGTYKIIGIEHFGTISSAVSGKCKTIVSLLLNVEQFNVVREGVSNAAK